MIIYLCIFFLQINNLMEKWILKKLKPCFVLQAKKQIIAVSFFLCNFTNSCCHFYRDVNKWNQTEFSSWSSGSCKVSYQQQQPAGRHWGPEKPPWRAERTALLRGREGLMTGGWMGWMWLDEPRGRLKRKKIRMVSN